MLNALALAHADPCPEGEEVFRYGHSGAYGFCPYMSERWSVSIVATPDGAHMLCRTCLAEAGLFRRNCISGTYEPDQCLIELAHAPVRLSRSEMTEFEVLLQAVPDGELCDEEPITADFCLKPTYVFDGRNFDGVCTNGELTAEAAAALGGIDGFLERIIARGGT